MPEFLQDPTFIATLVVGIATIVVAIAIARGQRKYKALTYKPSTPFPIVNVDRMFSPSVQVLYEGEQIESLELVFVDIRNTGNEPIRTADFESPVSINYGDEARVLESYVIETSPDGLDVPIISNQSSLTMQPILLNPKDSFSVGALLTNFKSTITVEGRIVGVEKIREARPEDRVRRRNVLFGVGVASGVVTGGVAAGILASAVPDALPNLALVASILALFTSVVARFTLRNGNVLEAVYDFFTPRTRR